MNLGSSSSGTEQGLGSLGTHKGGLQKLPSGYLLPRDQERVQGAGSEGTVPRGA